MKNFKQLVITGLLALLAGTPAGAFDGAVLKGIQIDSPDNRNYRIVIKTDRDVPVKKHITDANRVVLDMENIKPAQYVNTLYNNATEIEHVIVQPSSGNRLRIFLQGLNIAAGKVILDTRDEVPGPENIIPDLPSAPIFIDLSDRSVDKVKPVLPVVSPPEARVVPGSFAGKAFDAGVFDWVLRFAMLAVIVIAGIKFFNKPKNIEINLSSEKMKNREMDLLKTAEAQKELLTRSLGITPGAGKPVNSSLSQYGLREYQNSQLPPRKTAPTSPERPLLRPTAAPAQNTKLRQPVQTKITKKQIQKTRENFDGTKFLETMASIYQKSGRDDLASGIRQNIMRKQAG